MGISISHHETHSSNNTNLAFLAFLYKIDIEDF